MIKIICVGKLKEKYLIDLVNDYNKRINKYHKLEIIELKDTNIEEEGTKILEKINQNNYVIILDKFGKNLNSIEFSKKIDSLFTTGHSDILFIVGGSDGISEKVKEKSDYSISFSNLTFPHGLFRGILLEQIYRAFKILNNEKYHK